MAAQRGDVLKIGWILILRPQRPSAIVDHEPDVREPGLVEGRTQAVHDPLALSARMPLVLLGGEILHLEPPLLARPLVELHEVIRALLGEETDVVRAPASVADPVRLGPGQRAQLDSGVDVPRLAHEPVIAAAVEVRMRQLLAGMGKTGLNRRRGVVVATDLHLQVRQRHPVVRLEHEVEDVLLDRGGIVHQLPFHRRRRRRSDAAPAPSPALAINDDGRPSLCRGNPGSRIKNVRRLALADLHLHSCRLFRGKPRIHRERFLGHRHAPHHDQPEGKNASVQIHIQKTHFAFFTLEGRPLRMAISCSTTPGSGSRIRNVRSRGASAA